MADDSKYPLGTKKETKEFTTRKKIKKTVDKLIKQIITDETYKAFEKVGYKKKEGNYFVYASDNGKEEKKGGIGTQESKVNITISYPKKYSGDNDTAPAISSIQKIITVGGKKIIVEVYINIKDFNLTIDYKITEDSTFNLATQFKGVDQHITINEIENKKNLEKELKNFFSSLANIEASYLLDTKIAQDDKIEKNQNASLTMENIYKNAQKSISKLIKETDKIINEISTSPNPIAGPINGETLNNNNSETSTGGSFPANANANTTIKRKFKSKGEDEEVVADNNNQPIKEDMTDEVKKTPYGEMKQKKAYIVKEDGTYNVKVEFEPGSQNLNVPKGMKKNYALGMHGIDVNSKEELSKTGHGELSALEEDFKRKIDLIHRKFILKEENEKKGINKRYIITEKLTAEEESKRFKQLVEVNSFERIKEIPGNLVDDIANKEYEKNQETTAEKEYEGELDSTPYCGEEDGFVIIPKTINSMVMFKLNESDIKSNKPFIKDYFTNKIVPNPLYK